VPELDSDRGRRLPAGTAKFATAIGACLCATQLLPAAEVPAQPVTPSALGVVPAVTTPAPEPPTLPVEPPRRPRVEVDRASRGERARRDRPERRGPRAAARGSRIVAEAARHTGAPYRFGASGPSAFDCSGFTSYVFGKFGIALPHKADAQENHGRPVARSAARPGDLVFFRNGSYAHHVGIYAGGGYMYDAPRTGRTVGRHKIWSKDYMVRRLLG
jgi:cell wall-associated NlpC family hydrolase